MEAQLIHDWSTDTLSLVGQTNSNKIKPFLKWAGGKRWLVPILRKVAPANIDNYFEPFVGSGAIFFSLSHKRAHLSDTNAELIETYHAVKNQPKLVYRYLLKHQRSHCKQYYYETRAKRARSSASQAARVIYLNRTCFNGLYRVNRDGIFNVPKGSKDTVIFPDDDFNEYSSWLTMTELSVSNFEESIDKAINLGPKGSFVYIDPPYVVNHNRNGFLKYNENLFTWEDQLRLYQKCLELYEAGVPFVMSNADHSSIRELYGRAFQIYKLDRKSVLSGNKAFRKPVSEILVSNYF